MVLEFLASIMQSYGLLGVFLATLAANASIILPIPVDILIIALGASGAFNPWALGLTAGLAAAIGELTAYLLGFLGYASLQRIKPSEIKRIDAFAQKVGNAGMPFLVLVAFTPFPFDLAGMAAGLIKYDVKRFFLAALIGKEARYLLLAFAGVLGVEAVKAFFGVQA